MHCVSKDFKMTGGIAVRFRDKYERVDELEAQCPQIGDIAVLEHENRYLYYMVTKEKYNDRPRIDDLAQALVNVKRHALKNGVTRINCPKIGCGMDKLKWDKVYPILNGVFSYSGIAITVYYI